jgi:hypothetical protein
MIGKDLFVAPHNGPSCRSRAYGRDRHGFSSKRYQADNDQNKIVLTKLSAPVYPHLERATRISGNVQLLLRVRQDGTIDSFEVVSGHALLQQAGMDSAKQSQFDCFQRAGSLTSYALMYTFKIHERGSCCEASPSGTSDKEPAESFPKVIPSQNHITLLVQPLCICEPGPDRRVRSPKCLYLWRCSSR